jgi:hypothetical protein
VSLRCLSDALVHGQASALDSVNNCAPQPLSGSISGPVVIPLLISREILSSILYLHKPSFFPYFGPLADMRTVGPNCHCLQLASLR